MEHIIHDQRGRQVRLQLNQIEGFSLPDLGCKLIRGNRFAEKISLHLVATVSPQILELRLRLHPLCDHPEPHAMGQGDHRCGDSCRIGIGDNVGNE